MTVFHDKARNRWRYDFRLDGTRYSGYCVDPDTGQPAGNKTEARRCESLVHAAAIQAKPAPAAPTLFTVAQMFVAYATRKQALKDWPNKRVYVADLIHFFGPETAVVELGEQRIWEYIAWARSQPVLVYKGGPKARTPEERLKHYHPTDRNRADSTINRYLVTLGEALRIAHGLRDGAGRLLLAELPKVPKLAEAQHLPRPVSDSDLEAIMAAAPAHLRDGMLLARLMGFRKAEVFGLTIDQIDFQQRGVWLEASDTKANRAEFIPANPEAMELLTRLVQQARGWKVTHLLTYQHGEKGERKPVKNPKRAWATALAKVGLKHRFHDTKASFVTAVAHVAPAAVTQQLARHKSYETTRRYLRVADAAARQAVEGATMASLRVGTGSTSTQEFHTAPADDASAPDGADKEKALEPLGSKAFPALPELVGATGFEPATLRPPV